MSAKTKILVTGGAGYLGSVLVPELLREGYAVTVLDRFLYCETSLLQCCAHPDFTVVRGDCRERDVLAPLVSAADYLIPLAALVGAPACAQDQTLATTLNLDAIRLLLELRSRQQRIVFPTSNSGYGIGEKGKFCTEETPLRPLTLYGRSKVEAEEAVLEAGNAVTFRLATVFGIGPRMRLDLLVNDFVYRAVTDRAVVLFEAHAKRNYIHVRDVSLAFRHALTNFDAMQGRPYNVGLSDANLSKLELCERIKLQIPEFTFLDAPIGEDPDKRDYIVSNARIEATGYRPLVSLDAGITELRKGYQMLRNVKYGNV